MLLVSYDRHPMLSEPTLQLLIQTRGSGKRNQSRKGAGNEVDREENVSIGILSLQGAISVSSTPRDNKHRKKTPILLTNRTYFYNGDLVVRFVGHGGQQTLRCQSGGLLFGDALGLRLQDYFSLLQVQSGFS